MLPRLLRHALASVTLLVALLLMVLLTGERIDWAGATYGTMPAIEWVLDGVGATFTGLGRGLHVWLPVALLVGGLAGAFPGRLVGRIALLPQALLLATPPILALPLLMLHWSLPFDHFAWDLLAYAPWVALATRDGLLGARDEAGRLRLAALIPSLVGRLLQQAGNLAIAGSLIDLAVARPEAQRLLAVAQLGIHRANFPLATYALVALALIGLVGGLLGDLLIHWVVRYQRPAFRPTRPWLLLGLLVAALWLGGTLGIPLIGMEQFAPLAAAGRQTLTVGLVALLTAAVGGLSWALASRLVPARWVSVLAPRTPLANLLGPFLGGVMGIILLGPKGMGLTLGLGLGSMPMAAYAIRRWLESERGEERHLARYALLGSLAILLAQAMVVEFCLTSVRMALPSDPQAPTLGALFISQLRDRPAILLTSLTTWAGISGLFLLGLALSEGAGMKPQE